MKLVLERIIHQPGQPLVCHLGDRRLQPGYDIRLRATGRLFCIACGRATRRTYRGGLCFPCSQTLARADSCIVRPHTCHFHRGTCREPDWGRQHCFQPHVVYLALTSHLKVGVTAARRTFARWSEQGAGQAVVLAECPDRRQAGIIEHALSRHFSDRTNWRALLAGGRPRVDWQAEWWRAARLVPRQLQHCLVEPAPPQALTHPVDSYPARPRSQHLEKQPLLAGRLTGILGQYLLLGDVVLNVRRHAGHEVEIEP